MIHKKCYPNGLTGVRSLKGNEPSIRGDGNGTIVGDCNYTGCMWWTAKSEFESPRDGISRGCGTVTGLCQSNGIGEG